MCFSAPFFGRASDKSHTALGGIAEDVEALL